ncbi:hypothetical protein P8452_33008 [Trifolium repens]|nr:hypothetical protein P8452_33008 [Trifolium repens]
MLPGQPIYKYHLIVSERVVDLIDNLILSVSIDPPNSQFLKSTDKSKWTAKDVADSVLSANVWGTLVCQGNEMSLSNYISGDAHSIKTEAEKLAIAHKTP